MTKDSTSPTTDHAQNRATGNLFYFTLPAPDLERSKVFFSRLFGWDVSGGSLGGHIANVTPAGGLFPGGDPGDRNVYLTVYDLDAAAAKVVQLGGQVEVRQADVGARKLDHMP